MRRAVGIFFLALFAAAARAEDAVRWTWTDGRELPIEGKAFADTERYYDRLPDAKAPLNAKGGPVVTCDGFTLQNVLFESLPGVYVVGHLFLPDAAKFTPSSRSSSAELNSRTVRRAGRRWRPIPTRKTIRSPSASGVRWWITTGLI